MASEVDEITRLIECAAVLYGEYETLSDIADYCHVPRGDARAAFDAAGLKPNAQNRWPMPAAIRVLCSNKSPHQMIGQALRGDGDATPMGGQTKLALLAEAKAEEAKLRAQALRVKVEKASGDLISRKAVIQAVETSAIMTRDAFRGLPLKIAPRLIGATSAEQIAIILEDAIDETLTTAALSAEQILEDVLA